MDFSRSVSTCPSSHPDQFSQPPPPPPPLLPSASLCVAAALHSPRLLPWRPPPSPHSPLPTTAPLRGVGAAHTSSKDKRCRWRLGRTRRAVGQGHDRALERRLEVVLRDRIHICDRKESYPPTRSSSYPSSWTFQAGDGCRTGSSHRKLLHTIRRLCLFLFVPPLGVILHLSLD